MHKENVCYNTPLDGVYSPRLVLSARPSPDVGFLPYPALKLRILRETPLSRAPILQLRYFLAYLFINCVTIRSTFRAPSRSLYRKLATSVSVFDVEATVLGRINSATTLPSFFINLRLEYLRENYVCGSGRARWMLEEKYRKEETRDAWPEAIARGESGRKPLGLPTERPRRASNSHCPPKHTVRKLTPISTGNYARLQHLVLPTMLRAFLGGSRYSEMKRERKNKVTKEIRKNLKGKTRRDGLSSD